MTSWKAHALAKTSRPKLNWALPRERLFKQLDQLLYHPVVWLRGPPGAGKTTLAAGYVAARDKLAVWYQLDDGDADLRALIYSLNMVWAKDEIAHDKPVISSSIWPTEPQNLTMMAGEFPDDAQAFARHWFRELFAKTQQTTLLVLDNYEQLPPQADLHLALPQTINDMPPHIRLLVISRNEPCRTLARLRANQQLALLDYSDLRLTREESDAIVHHRVPDIDTEQLPTLFEKTEGWPAGLILMLESFRLHRALPNAPDLTTSSAIFDYLAGEFFAHLQPTVKKTLLQLGTMNSFTVEAAIELSGDPQLQTLLDSLAYDYGLVTQSIHDERTVYQFHPLLLEFLRREADTHTDSKTLHRAAQVLHSHGQTEQAIGLLLRIGNFSQAFELLQQHAFVMLEHGRGEILNRWLENLPHEQQQEPWVLLWLGAYRFAFAPRQARRYYQQAFERWSTDATADYEGLLLSGSGVLDAILHEMDDLTLLDEWIDKLQKLWSKMDGCLQLDNQILTRITASMLIALMMRQPFNQNLESWADRAVQLCSNLVNNKSRTYIALFTAIFLMWVGRFRESASVIASVKPDGDLTQVPLLMRSSLYNIESMLHMLRGNSAACAAAVKQGLASENETGVHIWHHQLIAHGIGGALADSNLDLAKEFNLQHQQKTHQARKHDLLLQHFMTAWQCFLADDVVGAYQQQRSALNLAIEVGNPFFEMLCRICIADTLQACGDDKKCIFHVRKSRTAIRAIRNPFLSFTSQLTLAGTALNAGRDKTAINFAAKAFRVGREFELYHCLWWNPSRVAQLCVVALEHQLETEYVARLVKRRRLTPLVSPLWLVRWPWSIQVRVLGTPLLIISGNANSNFGNAQHKPLELLRWVIVRGCKNVAVTDLIRDLWPNIETSYALKSLNTNLHRLRKLLGIDNAISLAAGKISIDNTIVWSDVGSLLAIKQQLDEYANDRNDAHHLIALADGLLNAFTKPDAHSQWHEHCKAWEEEFIQLARHLATALNQHINLEAAQDFLVRVLKLLPTAQICHIQLLEMLIEANDLIGAKNWASHCTRSLKYAEQQSPVPQLQILLEKLT